MTIKIRGVPDSNVHGANMGSIWGRQDPGEPHVGPMNFAIWGSHMSNAYLPYLVMLVKQYQLLFVETVAGIRGVVLYIYVRSKKFQLSEQTRANVHYLYFIWHTWHEMWMFTCKHWERTRPRWTQPTHGTTDIPIRRKLNLVKIDSLGDVRPTFGLPAPGRYAQCLNGVPLVPGENWCFGKMGVEPVCNT